MINDCLSFYFIIFLPLSRNGSRYFLLLVLYGFILVNVLLISPLKYTLPLQKKDTLVSKVLPTFKCFLSGFLLFPNFQAFRELKNENASA